MAQTIATAELRARFVEAATAKFANNVPDFVTLQALVADNGGRFRNDHAAIRTADPAVRDLWVEAAAVLGLRRDLDYAFPAKKLVSFDLQVPGDDSTQFKIFVSQVDLDAFPPDVAALIREDCEEQAAAVDHSPFGALIAKAGKSGLEADEAQAFIEHFVDRLMSRNGPPMKRSTLQAVADVSGEAASALALGPDFNHVTIDVLAAGYAGIDEMTAAMRERGFRLLPKIQGEPGSKLRQTATMAATMETPVREADGRIGSAQTERQFVEIIERGLVDNSDGAPRIFKNFLAANAEQIFGAAATRSRTTVESC
ncbi:MAG: VOC family protein [Gammaproteobacteria bacterium]|nr:VOC family protein [Gammaproteobacteria bacterium]